MTAPDNGPPMVGWIGLGDMGGPMVTNLCAAGWAVRVFDLSAVAMAEARQSGAVAVDGLSQVVDGTDIVCVVVVDDHQVRKVTIDDGGVLHAMHGGQLLVIHSTILPETVEEIAAVAAARGVSVLDAPVSGARPASIDGTLSIIVGGEVDDLARAKPMFDVVGKHVYHMGALGSGQRTKIVNNVMLHGNHAVMMEALRLATAFDLDEERLLEVVAQSSGNSWLIETFPYIDDILFSHTLAGTEAMYHLMTKELWNAVKSARLRHVGMPVTAVAIETYRNACLERIDQLVARGTFPEIRDED